MEQNLTQNVDSLFSNLEGFTQNEGLIGKPVTQGDKTFIPVVSVTIGYGSGNTASKAQQGNSSSSSSQGMSPLMGTGNMSGGALGLGAKLCTDAIICIDKDNVSVLPINTSANSSQLMDKIPQILSGMGSGKQQGQQGQSQQGQQGQGQQAQAQSKQ